MNIDDLKRFAALGAACAIPAIMPAPAPAQEPPPPAQAAASPDAQVATGDQVVQMEAFSVSTTIGAYHEETSSMATKVPTDLKELASSLQILNANAIADRNAVTLQDIFQYVVGMTQSQQNVNGFTFRGFAATGSFLQNVEYDGLQGPTMKKGAQSAANIESVEFLKGPNSVLYGQMRPGGLLNLVTKSPQEKEGIYMRATFGTYAGTYSSFGGIDDETLSIDLTGPIDSGKHWLYRIIVDGENAPNYRLLNYDKLFSVFPSLTYRFSADTSFTIKMEASQDRRRTDDGVLPIFTNGIAFGKLAAWYTAPLNTVYQDPTDVSRDKGEAFSTSFQTKFAGIWTARLQTRTVWHVDEVHELATNSTTVFSPSAKFITSPNITTLKRLWEHVKNGHRYNYYDANAFAALGPQSFQNTVIVGVGGGDEFFDNTRYAFAPNVTPTITLFNPILGQTPYPAEGTTVLNNGESFTSFGSYVSDQMKVGDRLHITIGTRYNQQAAHGSADTFHPAANPYVHDKVSAFTSQAGVVFDLTSLVSAYACYSQSFLPNDVTSVDQFGNSGFGPERGYQEEGGFKIENVSHTLYASIAGYFINRTNVLVGVNGVTVPGTGQAIFQNDGQQHSEGIEFETEWQPLPYWQVQGGFALSKAFIAESRENPQTVGDDLSNAPRASANFWTRYNVPDGVLRGLGVGVGIIYTGKQWGGADTSAVYFAVPGWARTDLAFYYKWKRYDLALNVQNLFDRKYYLAVQAATAIFPGDERKLTLSVDTHF